MIWSVFSRDLEETLFVFYLVCLLSANDSIEFVLIDDDISETVIRRSSKNIEFESPRGLAVLGFGLKEEEKSCMPLLYGVLSPSGSIERSLNPRLEIFSLL